MSIVTVTYNCKDLLESTILSVINQSYKHIEYIIIDGASTDGTLDIIKKYEEHIDYWISEPDEGIYYAMNKAIEKASGEWINFMNAGDSFADNNTVRSVINNLDSDTDIIYGDHLNSKREVCSVEHRQDVLISIPCCHQSMFARTKLMKENPFNTLYNISADYDFILKMYKHSKKIQYIREPISVYLEGGLSERDKTQRELETLASYINNKVDASTIINTVPYSSLIKQSLQYKKLNKQYNELSKLKHLIYELSCISILKHPLKKVKKYKEVMVLLYAK